MGQIPPSWQMRNSSSCSLGHSVKATLLPDLSCLCTHAALMTTGAHPNRATFCWASGSIEYQHNTPLRQKKALTAHSTTRALLPLCAWTESRDRTEGRAVHSPAAPTLSSTAGSEGSSWPSLQIYSGTQVCEPVPSPALSYADSKHPLTTRCYHQLLARTI